MVSEEQDRKKKSKQTLDEEHLVKEIK